MSARDTGGQAFPLSYEGPNSFGNPTGRHVEPGMSLRDYLAAGAMQALVAKPGAWSRHMRTEVARAAYDLADAMLSARGAV